MSGRPECSKKPVQQGRSLFGARSVLPVREHGKKARTPLADFFNIPYEEDQPNLEGTNNRSGTKQQRWTKDYIKRSFWPSIYRNCPPLLNKNTGRLGHSVVPDIRHQGSIFSSN